MGRLDGRTALVTGGGRGLGAAIAEALSGAGARVALGARSVDAVESVAARLRASGAEAVGLGLDVTDHAGVVDAVRRVTDALGPVDVLVNNAGVVWPLGRLTATDGDEWEASFDVNLFGAVRCIRAVLPGMLERGWGRIVNLSSGSAAGSGMPAASAYSAGKAGLDMVTRNLADELDGSGVTVSAVRPGVVDTSMQDYMRSLPREQVGDAFYEKFHGLHQSGQLWGPEPAARLVVALVSGARTGDVVDVRDDDAVRAVEGS